MRRNRFDGHEVALFHDVGEDEWFAYFIRIPDISACALTPSSALDALAAVWDDVNRKCSTLTAMPPDPVQ